MPKAARVFVATGIAFHRTAFAPTGPYFVHFACAM